MKEIISFCNLDPKQILKNLNTSQNGLTEEAANARLKQFGSKIHTQSKKWKTALLLIEQFKSPIMLILIFAAVLSVFLGDATDAIIILIILYVF